MIPPFVKKFDFRGVYGKEIKDIDAYYLARAIKKTLTLKKILIGWDTRESSKNLAFNFINALKGKNIEICCMDKCPIDYVTSASYVFDFDLSVMFTGSHHPWTWTGLLMHERGGNSIQGELVNKIINNYYQSLEESYENKAIDLSEFNPPSRKSPFVRSRDVERFPLRQDFSSNEEHGLNPRPLGHGSFKNFYEETEQIYTEKIKSFIPLSQIKEMKVLVDLGDGSGSRSLSLLEKLIPQVKFSRINDRNLYDAESSHNADPANLDNMEELIEQVKSAKNYACGFAFDSDADRVLAVDETGEYVNGSLLGSAHIDSFINLKNSDKLFGYAVDCGLSTPNAVLKLKNEADNTLSVKPIPVGRSLLRQMLRDGKLDFGVENVGHFYSKDFFMTDSGVFSLAMILYWISKNGPLSNLKLKYPDGFRGQIFSRVLNKKEISNLSSEINKLFINERSRKIDIDGIRYEFYEGDYISSWYTIRNSGYEKITKCYFGSLDSAKFKLLKEEFDTVIEAQKEKVGLKIRKRVDTS